MVEGYHFDPGPHVHTLNGVVLPGVTSVLKAEHFVDDRWWNDNARDRGTYIHQCIQALHENDLDESRLLSEYAGFIGGYRAFLIEKGFVATEVERPVCSISRMFAGVLDLIGTFRGNPTLTLIDAKTGDPGEAVKLQTAAYRFAYYEETKTYIPERYALQLSREGTYKLHGPFLDQSDETVFLSAVNCWWWRQNHARS